MGQGHYTGIVWGLAHRGKTLGLYCQDDTYVWESMPERDSRRMRSAYECKQEWVGVFVASGSGMGDGADLERFAVPMTGLAAWVKKTMKKELAAAKAVWARFRAHCKAQPGKRAFDPGPGGLVFVADYD